MENKEFVSPAAHQGNNVKIARLTKGVRQKELAHKLNMDQRDISILEGQQTIADDILKNIALALECSFPFLKEFNAEDIVQGQTRIMNVEKIEQSEGSSVNNNAEITNNFPLVEIMQSQHTLLEMQKEHYENAMEMLRQSGQKDTEIALLKKELEAFKKK